MTSESKTADELLELLLGMGFDLEDCQEAIKHGKLSGQDAVEWLLNGKPGRGSSSNATLKLNLNQASSMDTIPAADSGIQNQSLPTPAFSSTDPDAMDAEPSQASHVTDNELSTRMFVSGEQRLVKQRFDDKQREEARRVALAEKQAKKKAREEALRRIQEDREQQKQRGHLRSSAPDSSVPSVSPQVVGGPSATSESAVPTKDASSAAVALIQIRLPSGQTLKHSFPEHTCVNDICHFVVAQCSQCKPGSFILIQPFPRLEFTGQFLNKTLRDLGLVPSGSLVVKLIPTPTAASDEPTASPSAPPDVSNNPSSAASSLPTYNWGSEPHVLHDENPVADQPAEINQSVNDGQNVEMEADEHVNNVQPVDDDDDDEAVGIDFAGHFPHQNVPAYGMGRGANNPGHQPDVGPGWAPGGLPGFGGIGAFPGMGRGQPGWGPVGVMGQHMWGDGQRLAGEVLENVVLPHHRQDPRELAAEAARRRYGTNPPPSSTTESKNIATSAPTADIPTLRLLVIKYITVCICSNRQTFTGLHGLPGTLALQILDHVVKEGLLRPKILQVFISCHLNDINLDSYPYCTNELLAALRHHIYLKHVSLNACPLITHHGLQHLTALKNLKHLDIGSCQQISDDVIPVLAAMPSIVTLVLEDTAVTDAGIILYANSKPPNLQNLDLSRTSVTQHCFQALHAIPCLKQLNLEQTKVTGLSGIEGLTQLRTLNLANTAIVSDSLLCIRDLSTLSTLNLGNTSNVNGDMALQYIADLKLSYLQLPNRITTTDRGISFIKNMPLLMLDLTNFIYITDASLEHIGRISTLRKLRLSNTKITDAGLPFLEGLQDLNELHIDRTSVTDIGAGIVRAFPRLHELNLSHTNVTDGFLISGTLDFCRQLSKLNLSKTGISDKGLVRLRLQQLTMLNIDSTYCQPDVAQKLSGCPNLTSVIFCTLMKPPTNHDL